MLVLPLPVTPRSRRVAPEASWRPWRAFCWAGLRGIGAILGSFGDFGAFLSEVRSEEGMGVETLFEAATGLREDLGSLMAPRAARPAGRMRLAQAGRGER